MYYRCSEKIVQESFKIHHYFSETLCSETLFDGLLTHHLNPLCTLLKISTMQITAQCSPYMINWRLIKKPAMKHMTNTAVGQADHATESKKAIKAHADTNMHTAGRRDDMQKNRYLPYKSRASFWGALNIMFHMRN